MCVCVCVCVCVKEQEVCEGRTGGRRGGRKVGGGNSKGARRALPRLPQLKHSSPGSARRRVCQGAPLLPVSVASRDVAA